MAQRLPHWAISTQFHSLFHGFTHHAHSGAALDREFEEAIEAILMEIAGGKDSINGMAVRAIAVSLTGIIDGFWLQFLIAPGRLSREEAIRSCRAYLSAFFPQFALDDGE
ncbi:TetR family transcriptional regulator C-terminal domain-containing protein [Pseudodesulfovibrio indicus]|uniref:TetR family transcriptional regulator C-terminal domain-containing protein n=1 Tax=Pseudodesulfovibrio indicus TaxID=1716143 RepID=UPI00292E48AA|nr:TetR family transcriptional regulator C-terminal domain-containing protein [Pseudodesulfovibrio indicus]